MTTVVGNQKIIKTYNNDFCSGIPASTTTSIFSSVDCVNQGPNGYYKSFYVDTVPQNFLSMTGYGSVIFSSDSSKCVESKDWTWVYFSSASRCSPSFGSRDKQSNQGVTIGGWGNPKFTRSTSCSADHLTTTIGTFGEATCTSKTATATFYADTNGAAGTTLYIRNAVCINHEDNGNPCTVNNL
jgi:hypothetical protein